MKSFSLANEWNPERSEPRASRFILRMSAMLRELIPDFTLFTACF
jgi:hypothetical protein